MNDSIVGSCESFFKGRIRSIEGDSPEEAADLLKSHFDAVISDIRMRP